MERSPALTRPMTPINFADVRKLELNANQLGVWWLGQASFLLKTGAGQVALIDPWLTGGPIGSGPGSGHVGPERMTPPPLQPEDIHPDLLLISHDHLDHLDLPTLRRLPAGLTCPIVGPRRVLRRLRDSGFVRPADAARLIQLDAGDAGEPLAGLKVTATFCIPNEEKVIDTVGFFVQPAGGPSFLMLGDTGYHDFLNYMQAFDIDVLAVPVNAGWGNLPHRDAANLCRLLRPKTVLPYHYGCFPHNDGDPHDFRKALIASGRDPSLKVLQAGELWVVERR